MQELLENSRIPSSTVYGLIINNKKFQEKMIGTDMKSIKTLLTDGFSKLDVTLIYKIVKYFNLIPTPTQQWGAIPRINDIGIGDDVERIRLNRNDFVHRTDCEVTDTEFNAFFDAFIELGRRIDVYLGKSSDEGFEKDITYFKTCPMDEDLQGKYIEALEKIVCLQEKAKFRINENEVHVYFGTAIEELIKDRENITDSTTTPVRMIIKGVDNAEEKADILNFLADQINNRNSSIQFKHARKGSLILHVTIQKRILQNQKTLVFELTNFLERVFRMENNLELNALAEVNIIPTVDEDGFDLDHFDITEEIYPSSEGKHSLLMDLEVSSDVLRTDDTFQESIGEFFENILTKTDGKHLFPEKEVTAIVLPGANEVHCQGNRSADSLSAVNASIRNMDLDQEMGHAQALT